jgi:hypothetical protein
MNAPGRPVPGFPPSGQPHFSVTVIDANFAPRLPRAVTLVAPY